MAAMCICVLLLLQSINISTCNSTQVGAMYNLLATGYNPKLLPVKSYGDTVYIGIAVAIASLNSFDELSGELSLTLLLHVHWIEERMTWSRLLYPIGSLLFSPQDIWHPYLLVAESFSKSVDIGNNAMLIRLFSDGVVYWFPGDVIKVSCSVDVTYFPFDTQICQLTISSWAYTSSELTFYAQDPVLSMQHFQKNSQWDVLPSSVVNRTTNSSGPSGVALELRLSRRSEFYVVYLICPIIFLGIINNFVFLMPAECGERTSVAVTTFLSFVVYMDIVNNNVPTSSAPVAFLIFYILFLLIYSILIMILCIISLRIYGKEGSVPPSVRIIVVWLRFSCIRTCSAQRKTDPMEEANTETRVAEINDMKEQDGASTHEADTCRNTEIASDSVTEGAADSLTWTDVGNTFDVYCATILCVVHFTTTLVVFVLLYTNYGL